MTIITNKTGLQPVSRNLGTGCGIFLKDVREIWFF